MVSVQPLDAGWPRVGLAINVPLPFGRISSGKEGAEAELAMEQAKKEPRTKPGDIWLLREHRLKCGDAADAAVVEDLLGDKKASMAF
ncbi:MAG: hypothetical protein IH918_09445, partial [Acidobacteria bacterium]|nr:hypothetical protein [Acidobacteriota bacterium]